MSTFRLMSPTSLRRLAGLALCVVALGLLYALVAGPMTGPQAGSLPWSAAGRTLFALFLFVLAAGAAGLAWLLLRVAFRSVGRGRGRGETPGRTVELPRTSPAVYIILVAVLVGLVALFVWLAGRRETSDLPVFERFGAIVTDLLTGADAAANPGPLLTAASSLLGLAVVAASLSGILALVMALLGRALPAVAVEVRSRRPGAEVAEGEPPEAGPATRLFGIGEVKDPQEGVLRAYEAVVRLLDVAGVETEGLTPRELCRLGAAELLAAAGFEASARALAGLTSLYERCRYSPRPATASDFGSALEAYRLVESSLGQAGVKADGGDGHA